jgi:hypothetical protein
VSNFAQTQLNRGDKTYSFVYPRKETSCHTDTSFPSLQLPSLSARVFRQMPSRGEAAVFALEAFMEGFIVAASIVVVFTAEPTFDAVWRWVLVPLPWVQQ